MWRTGRVGRGREVSCHSLQKEEAAGTIRRELNEGGGCGRVGGVGF